MKTTVLRIAAVIALVTLLAAGAGDVRAAVEVVLVDGQILRGESAEQVDGVVRIAQKDGSTISVGANVVAEIRDAVEVPSTPKPAAVIEGAAPAPAPEPVREEPGKPEPVISKEKAPPVRIVTVDGQTFDGVEISQDGGVYRLRKENGTVLGFPLEVVEDIELAGVGGGPSGMRTGKPQTLAGPLGAGEAPSTSQQIMVFGEPRPAPNRNILDPNWYPTSDWDNDPILNNFNPSRWYVSPMNPAWTPQSAFDMDADVLAAGHARWFSTLGYGQWVPEDAFARRDAFWDEPEEPFVPEVVIEDGVDHGDENGDENP